MLYHGSMSAPSRVPADVLRPPLWLLLLAALLVACPSTGSLGTPSDDDDAAPLDDDDTVAPDDDDAVDDDDSAPDDDDSAPDDDDESAPDDDDSAGPVIVLWINEVAADNGGAVLDDLGNASDWFEIHNPGPSPLHLAGYTVTDAWTDPGQHSLPAGLVVPAGGFLLLWADGATNPTGAHLPFRLASAGEAVGLFDPAGRSVDWVEFPPMGPDEAWARMPDGSDDWLLVAPPSPGATNVQPIVQQSTLVAQGAAWRYLDTGVAPPADWTDASFDASLWSEGPAPLGYGDPVATEVSFGPDPAAKHITTWFRHAFSVDAATAADAATLTASLRVDDGALVRLNGQEIVRANLPAGVIAPDTPASTTVSGAGELAYADTVLPAVALVEGTNVLAVEVHQVVGNSSDLVLDVGLSAELWIDPR